MGLISYQRNLQDSKQFFLSRLGKNHSKQIRNQLNILHIQKKNETKEITP